MIGLYFEIIGSVLSILVVISLLSCAQVKKNDTEQYQTATSEENRIQSEVNGLLAKGDIQGVLDICKKSYSRYLWAAGKKNRFRWNRKRRLGSRSLAVSL